MACFANHGLRRNMIALSKYIRGQDTIRRKVFHSLRITSPGDVVAELRSIHLHLKKSVLFTTKAWLSAIGGNQAQCCWNSKQAFRKQKPKLLKWLGREMLLAHLLRSTLTTHFWTLQVPPLAQGILRKQWHYRLCPALPTHAQLCCKHQQPWHFHFLSRASSVSRPLQWAHREKSPLSKGAVRWMLSHSLHSPPVAVNSSLPSLRYPCPSLCSFPLSLPLWRAGSCDRTPLYRKASQVHALSLHWAFLQLQYTSKNRDVPLQRQSLLQMHLPRWESRTARAHCKSLCCSGLPVKLIQTSQTKRGWIRCHFYSLLLSPATCWAHYSSRCPHSLAVILHPWPLYYFLLCTCSHHISTQALI